MSKIRRKMQLLEMDRHRLEEESAPGDGAVTHGNALMPESFVPDSGDNIIASESDVRDGSCDDDSDVQIINVIAGDSDDEEESRMEPEDVEHDMKRQDLTKVNEPPRPPSQRGASRTNTSDASGEVESQLSSPSNIAHESNASLDEPSNPTLQDQILALTSNAAKSITDLGELALDRDREVNELRHATQDMEQHRAFAEMITSRNPSQFIESHWERTQVLLLDLKKELNRQRDVIEASKEDVGDGNLDELLECRELLETKRKLKEEISEMRAGNREMAKKDDRILQLEHELRQFKDLADASAKRIQTLETENAQLQARCAKQDQSVSEIPPDEVTSTISVPISADDDNCTPVPPPEPIPEAEEEQIPEAEPDLLELSRNWGRRPTRACVARLQHKRTVNGEVVAVASSEFLGLGRLMERSRRFDEFFTDEEEDFESEDEEEDGGGVENDSEAESSSEESDGDDNDPDFNELSASESNRGKSKSNCEKPSSKKSDSTTTNQSEEPEHIRILQKTIRHTCGRCKEEFESTKSFRRHFKSKHPDYCPFKCAERGCRKRFQSVERMEKHRVKKHGVAKAPLCEICNRRYHDMEKHMEYHSKSKGFVCKEPGCLRVYETAEEAESHFKKRHGLKRPHVCTFPGCGKRFTRLWSRDNHYLLHVTGHTIPCKADGCKKMFRSQALMMSHYKTHTGEKPFECHLCGKKLSAHNVLKEHVNRHLGVREFRCQIDGCDAQFVTKSDLVKHFKSKAHAA